MSLSSTVARIRRRTGRLLMMAVTLGVVGLVVTLVAAGLGRVEWALVGVAICLMAVLVGLVAQQLNQYRLSQQTAAVIDRSRPSSTPSVPSVPSIEPVDGTEPGLGLAELIRWQSASHGAIADQHRVLAATVDDRLDAHRRDALEQQGALVQLMTAHAPASRVSLTGDDVDPAGLLELVEQISALGCDRVLALGLGHGTWWLVDSAERVVDVAEPASAPALRRLERSAPGGTGSVFTVPESVPELPHAHLPWYDLRSVPTGYQLIVVRVDPRRARAALPVVGLLRDHVVADGRVLVAAPPEVLDAWGREPGWAVEARTGRTLLLRRRDGGAEPADGADRFDGADRSDPSVDPDGAAALPDLEDPHPGRTDSTAPRTRGGSGSVTATLLERSATSTTELPADWTAGAVRVTAGTNPGTATGTAAGTATGAAAADPVAAAPSADDVSLVFTVSRGTLERVQPVLDTIAAHPRLGGASVILVHGPGTEGVAERAGGTVTTLRAEDDTRSAMAAVVTSLWTDPPRPYLVVCTLPRARDVRSLADLVATAPAPRSPFGVPGGTPILLATDLTPRPVIASYLATALATDVPDGVRETLARLHFAAMTPVLESIDPVDDHLLVRVWTNSGLDPAATAPPTRLSVVLVSGSRVVARSEPTALTPRVDRMGIRRYDDVVTRLSLAGCPPGHYRIGIELQDVGDRAWRSLPARHGAVLSARTVEVDLGPDRQVRYLLHATDESSAFLTVAVGPADTLDRAWRWMLLKKDVGFVVRGRGHEQMRRLRLLRLLTRPLYARRRVWLVGERSDTAQDNGMHLFAHLRREHRNRRAYYVIDSRSPQLARVRRFGRVVHHSSLRHRLLMLHAEVLANANSIHYLIPRGWPAQEYAYHLAWRVGALRVYLKHGVHLSPNAVKRGAQGYDLVLTATPGETAALREVSGYDTQLAEIGLPRYDALLPTPPSRTIVFMSTWRRYLVPKLFSESESGSVDYEGSTYQRFATALLTSDRLQRMLTEHDYRLVFVPHYNMAQYFREAVTAGDRVSVQHAGGSDLQDLLRRCDGFITDHSSVHFDVAYLDTPIIYARFDREEFETGHASPSWFDYERDGFGPVTYTLDDTLDALEELLARNCARSDFYGARIADQFTHRDLLNCWRAVAAIDRRLEGPTVDVRLSLGGATVSSGGAPAPR